MRRAGSAIAATPLNETVDAPPDCFRLADEPGCCAGRRAGAAGHCRTARRHGRGLDGELQYRDYQSKKWEGLPVNVKVKVQSHDDGVTVVRTAAFDDGPKTGRVYITTITQLDPATGRER